MSKRIQCPSCGEKSVEVKTVRNFKTKVRGVPFTVPAARIAVCGSCGEEIFDPAEIRRWQKLFDEALAESGGLLSASRVRAIRERLGMPISQFALLLGATRQSVYNWERDDRKSAQMKLIDLFLRLISESQDKGSVDVIAFLSVQAGIPQPLQRGSVTSSARRWPCLMSARSTLCEPSRYDLTFGVTDAPEELPRLRM
jgi:putative zinc finger/helix-turn-helix YgiT family protein